jgi:putative PIN family toxin of toxin-antitoxin system
VRAIIDTNVLLSGLLWHGAPHAVLEHLRAGTLTFVCSPALLTELADVIHRPKFAAILERSGVKPGPLMTQLRRLAEIVDPPPLPAQVSRDPDDDAVLALAVAAQVDLIVSGDGDRLDLASHQGIRIVSPADALQLIADASG